MEVKINTNYTFGFLFTLLLGSLHFGTSPSLHPGYSVGIFGNCEEIFMSMYNWKTKETKAERGK